jgi:hypothetical protein
MEDTDGRSHTGTNIPHVSPPSTLSSDGNPLISFSDISSLSNISQHHSLVLPSPPSVTLYLSVTTFGAGSHSIGQIIQSRHRVSAKLAIEAAGIFVHSKKTIHLDDLMEQRRGDFSHDDSSKDGGDS